MPQSIVTLLSDFGLKDHYVAAVKGALLSNNPDLQIVDISHEVNPFDIAQATYLLKNAYQHFPQGTIHIIGVDAELKPNNKHLAMKIEGHYFICADNGILSFLTEEINPEELFEINIHDRLEKQDPLMDVFVAVAGHILRGGQLGVIGKKRDKIKEITFPKPLVYPNYLVAHVIHIDSFGNAVTNMTKKEFERLTEDKTFEIELGSTKITKVFDRYSEVVDFSLDEQKWDTFNGKKLALFNSEGNLEIAVYKSDLVSVGGASTLFGLKERSSIRINLKS